MYLVFGVWFVDVDVDDVDVSCVYSVYSELRLYLLLLLWLWLVCENDFWFSSGLSPQRSRKVKLSQNKS